MDINSFVAKLRRKKYGQNIYIYGAGRYGGRVSELFSFSGIEFNGFIVSEGKREKKQDHTVFPVCEIEKNIRENDIVVLAIKDVEIEDVASLFLHRPEFIKLSNDNIYNIYNYVCFSWLKNRLQSAHNVDRYGEKKSGFDLWKKILVIRLDLIGDLICTTPFIRELRKNCTDAEITVVIRPQNKDILMKCPYIDRLITYDVDIGYVECDSPIELMNNIESKVVDFVSDNFSADSYDAVFLPTELPVGAHYRKMQEIMIAFLVDSGCRMTRMRDSHTKMNDFWYESFKDCFELISVMENPVHESEFQLQLLRDAGLNVEDDRLELWVDDKISNKVTRLLSDTYSFKYIIIAIGLVGSLPSKNWSPYKYAELINRLYEEKKELVFLLAGGMDSVQSADVVIGNLPENIQYNVINLTGKTTLNETIAWLSLSNMYVGADTSLMHIATAFGVPSVTLYRALADDYTDGPMRWGARRDDSIAILPKTGLDGCQVVCNKPYPHCINSISVEEVYDSVIKCLNSNVRNA